MNLPAVLLVGGIAIGYVVMVLPTVARRRRERDLPSEPIETPTAFRDVPREEWEADLPSLPDVDLPDGGSAD